MMRALGRLALAAVACAWAWLLYQMSRWLIVANRGLSLNVNAEAKLEPMYPVIEDDGLSDFRRDLDGRP